MIYLLNLHYIRTRHTRLEVIIVQVFILFSFVWLVIVSVQRKRHSLGSIQKHVVVESIFDRRPITEAAAIKALHGLPEDVSAGVPVHLRRQNKHTGVCSGSIRVLRGYKRE